MTHFKSDPYLDDERTSRTLGSRLSALVPERAAMSVVPTVMTIEVRPFFLGTSPE
jgi:hypothetical protein